MSKWTKGTVEITPEDNALSIWLKCQLKLNRMTCTELADQLGVSSQTVARWLRPDWKDSQRSNGFKKVHLLAICYLFGIKDDIKKLWASLNVR